MMPFVVVQLIAYWSPDGKRDLDDLFSSLERVDYPRESWRIVVVDNPSPHGRAAMYLKQRWLPQARVTLPEISLIESETNDGFAGGHERGLATSQKFGAEYLYLINQDVVVEPTFLWRVVQMAEAEPKCAAIQSRIMRKEEPHLLNSSGNALHFLGFGFCLGYRCRPTTSTSEDGGEQPFFYASGAGVLIRASVIEKVGGLFAPEYFMYHEDADFAWRARLAGFEICYAEDSIIYHRYEFSRSIQKFYWMERNRHLTNLINYKLATLALIAPLAIMVELGTLWFAHKSGWAIPKLKTWLHFLKPTTWIFIARRRAFVSRMRVVSDHDIMTHMVGAITNQELSNQLFMRVINPLMRIYFALLKFLVRLY
ncbi:MAG: glycosyltransferase family 2 protein [Patescibacteria group bacterium]